MSGKRPTLDDLVREAKDALEPARAARPIDWAKIEAELMPRVEREAQAQAALQRYQGGGGGGGNRRAWIAVGVAAAMAASVPLFFAGPRDAGTSASLGGQAGQAPERAASGLTWKEPRAVVSVTHAAQLAQGAQGAGAGGGTGPVEGAQASLGDVVKRGDAIEARGGRAVFDRTAPGIVTWGLEDGARATVRAAEGTLILALERGAVEAQVAPVAEGEAFAVDVGDARVAVHGTHLRVAREGTRAVVDLLEGVVSIGRPPRTGSTFGDLVTAPAHMEFDPADPHGTLKVSHDATRVRAAAVLEAPLAVASGASHPVVALPAPPVAAPPVSPPPQLAPPSAFPSLSPAASPVAPSAVAPASPPAAPPAPAPVVASNTAPPPAPAVTPLPAQPMPRMRDVTSPEPPPPAPARVDPNPERTIGEAIRTCARQQAAALPAGVVVTVTSRLELRIADDGMVQSARFDPPLERVTQDCAARVIYGTRFGTPGAASIPVDFTVP